HPRASRAMPTAAPLPDERYLDGRDPSLQARWLASHDQVRTIEQILGRPLPPVRDDFVTVPPPRVAALPGQRSVLLEAVQAYERQAAVVDPRLFRKVTLALKG